MTVVGGVDRRSVGVDIPEGLSAVEYHNLAVDVSRNQGNEFALAAVVKGLSSYPYDTDLLADVLSYAGDSGVEEYYERLRSIDHSRYTWRAFDFTVDYITDVLVPKAKDEQADRLLNDALSLADDFVRFFPSDERSYLAKIKVLKTRNQEGDREAIEEIFAQKVGSVCKSGLSGDLEMPVPAMSLHYADALLERGRYEDVVRVVRVGLATSAQEQSRVRVGYLCYLKALAEDALVHLDSLGEEGDGVFEDQTRIRKILQEYRTAYVLLEGSESYLSNIRHRSAVLAGMAGIEFAESGGVDRTQDGRPPVMDLLDGLMRDGR